MAQRKQKDLVSSLKSARLDFGLTQQELAKKTGIPRTTISKIEAGFRNTTLSTLLDLAKAVNLDLQLVKQEIIKKTKGVERSFETLNNIYIDSSAILSNYLFFKKRLPEHDIWPVLKANAYGHGIEEITQILKKVSPTFLVVDSYYEALQIWKISPKQKVLLIGALSPYNYPTINFSKLSIVVYDFHALPHLARLEKEVKIHLKINTGFNRQGIQVEQVADFCHELKKYPTIILEGVMSHFANADTDQEQTKKQERLFKQAIETVKDAGFKPTFTHISATAGAITSSNKNTNAIRLGIGLYGYNPLPEHHSHYKDIRIKPALTLTSSIVNIIELQAGDTVSYNGTFTAPRKMTIGVLPLGYYEVFDRKLSNTGFVKYADQQCPIVGTICMNMTMFDLKSQEARLYDPVKIISTKPTDKNSVHSLANLTKTIPYEVLTRINQTIRRNII